MRPEGNPLDLNNLPDEYSRDNGKQILEDSSSSGCRKKKSGGKDGKDECGKVYECRFCSLKFCKSQALGGHMNRHRQERETETLNQARQLVFRSDHNLAAQAAPHLGCCQPIGGGGGYHPSGNMGDPTVPLRFPRYFSASSSTHIPPPPPPPPPPPSQPYLYASPTRPVSFPTQFPHDYYVGHVLSSSTHGHYVAAGATGGGGGGADSGSYTCIGAPVGQAGGFVGGGGGGGNNKDGTVQLQVQVEESSSGGAGGLNWGRSYSGGSAQHRLDPSSAINRFQDGF